MDELTLYRIGFSQVSRPRVSTRGLFVVRVYPDIVDFPAPDRSFAIVRAAAGSHLCIVDLIHPLKTVQMKTLTTSARFPKTIAFVLMSAYVVGVVYSLVMA